ncbi:MAG TPA: tetratricopeptide repeat protein [Thermoanaerobaculia bacterium]|nr:tetratricopeptide repeat protein [Thermoanaerobaculia bacterium]
MRKNLVCIVTAIAVLILAAPLAEATCGGGGGGGVGGAMPRGPSRPGSGDPAFYSVPWKFLEIGAPPLKGPLILYWLPATREETQRSELQSSRQLSMNAAQCIGMQVILPDDKDMIEKLGATGKLPMAVLADGDGKVIQHVDNSRGALRVAAVEKMVRDELGVRDMAVYQELGDAKKNAAAGDKAAAIELYKKVWEQRCLFPRAAGDAQRALKDLGVTVKDAMLGTRDPNLSAAMTKRISRIMAEGVRAEIDGRYAMARERYRAASALDPADPVPLRYLGELYRHHTGEWDKARATFNRILTMRADPLSRAVALHGLGKITIHEGQYAKGLDLFEQSIASYPLALTYRNLAVYWNSERDHKKANGYVEKALAIDPHDPYNLIFAATYMADNGRADEALRVAKENEGALAASYNLAAIYSLLGNKGKAMSLLHRHFYQYERYEAVREKEMMEARVDYVFASMRNDRDFEELTAKAK